MEEKARACSSGTLSATVRPAHYPKCGKPFARAWGTLDQRIDYSRVNMVNTLEGYHTSSDVTRDDGDDDYKR